MTSGDLPHRFFLTQRFFDDLVALLRVPSTRFGHRSLLRLPPPLYGHLTLTYHVFRIWWDATRSSTNLKDDASCVRQGGKCRAIETIHEKVPEKAGFWGRKRPSTFRKLDRRYFPDRFHLQSAANSLTACVEVISPAEPRRPKQSAPLSPCPLIHSCCKCSCKARRCGSTKSRTDKEE